MIHYPLRVWRTVIDSWTRSATSIARQSRNMPVDNCYQRNPDTRSADVFAFAVIFIAMYACFGPACSAQQYSPNIGRTGSLGFKVSAELEALSDRSYVRRQLAMQRLLEAGPGIIDEVEPWLHAPELETRLSARKLLASLRNQRRELELSKLLEVDHKLDQLDLPCWPAFAKAAGNTRESRELFARLVRSHGDALEWLDGLKDDSGEARETA